jgi:superfamily II DNA or RNA helicase
VVFNQSSLFTGFRAMIDIKAAKKLLDFGARIGDGDLSRSQLQGAVALHNILVEKKVAYLADEVGFGKTYVALGTLALFRHFNPNFRVLIIAPRENIQNKWMKEWRSFVANNIRFADLRVKSLDGRPTRPIVKCTNLNNFVHETNLNPNRDFFLRMTSFSLPLQGEDPSILEASMKQKYEGLKKFLPWVPRGAFFGKTKEQFKDNYARAICCAMPAFDLIIVDEAHNLKKGFAIGGSSRNRVLSLTMGHRDPSDPDATKSFPGYRLKAKKILLLSATPVEDDYAQLWNQLDIFSHGGKFLGLRDASSAKGVTSEFLIRRVSQLTRGGETYTKNQYRREWRRGGVHMHDESIKILDPKQRLTVALIQKKVSEILGDERFNRSFQIGMLASFESFLETTKIKKDQVVGSNFDDADQTNDEQARMGIDVGDVNQISNSYREMFGKELPHPKMDAVVESLSHAWETGDKALIFVRRVASVKELKRKLEEKYDDWLKSRLVQELPKSLMIQLDEVFLQYQQEKNAAWSDDSQNLESEIPYDDLKIDRGGKDTFFAWYFRGEGPPNIISGANIQRRFIQKGTTFSTFFEDNYVADILNCRPGEVEEKLKNLLKLDSVGLRLKIQTKSQKYLSQAHRPQRVDRFMAVQSAAIECLKDQNGPHKQKALIIWQQRVSGTHRRDHIEEAPDIGNYLELKTFFTELRLRKLLRENLWPEILPTDDSISFNERELRAQMLSSAARLGHSFIDLYIMVINRIGSLELRSQEISKDSEDDKYVSQIDEYLDLLEQQMNSPLSNRGWSAFDELHDISNNFDLICDVNEVRASKTSTALVVGSLLRQQQPVGGISGQINQTLVRQFRMPGYPLILISTDVLQEGEDLHTFCSSVHHYGISWTASAMEQRIGRIDRVRSQTERRISNRKLKGIEDQEKLQVYYPYLEDTYEIYQVQSVIDRMDIFLKLMHKDLIVTSKGSKTINTDHALSQGIKFNEQFTGTLISSFPVQAKHRVGDIKHLEWTPNESKALEQQFTKLRDQKFSELKIEWEDIYSKDTLLGTVILDERIQPFTLILKSIGSHAIVRCISPIGNVDEDQIPEISTRVMVNRARLCAVESGELTTYNLTVESDIFFISNPNVNLRRVELLIRRVCQQADLFEQRTFPGVDAEIDKFKIELSLENRSGR